MSRLWARETHMRGCSIVLFFAAGFVMNESPFLQCIGSLKCQTKILSSCYRFLLYLNLSDFYCQWSSFRYFAMRQFKLCKKVKPRWNEQWDLSLETQTLELIPVINEEFAASQFDWSSAVGRLKLVWSFFSHMFRCQIALIWLSLVFWSYSFIQHKFLVMLFPSVGYFGRLKIHSFVFSSWVIKIIINIYLDHLVEYGASVGYFGRL